MKKVIVCLFAVFNLLGVSFAQDKRINCSFNEGVDLLSLVFRLSGASEYSQCMLKDYADEADRYFLPYKDHDAVTLINKIKKEADVSYDAVVSYGMHILIDDDGNVSFNDKIEEHSDPSFDRWPEEWKLKFLDELQSFYSESHFHDWYMGTAGIREQVRESFESCLNELDVQWFGSFFNIGSNSSFQIVLSLLVGPQNYGLHLRMTEGGELLTPIIGNCLSGNDGKPYFDMDMVLPIIVHEFCHSYCNPLNEKNWNKISRKAQEVFLLKEEMLSRQAYGNALIMLDETFVRSCVICYMSSHYPDTPVEYLIRQEEANGFVMVGTLYNSLNEYEASRDEFRTIEDYMPEYTRAVNDFNIEEYLKTEKEREKNRAKCTCNIQNGAKDVPDGIFTVELKFSRPMAGKGVAIGYSQTGADFPEFQSYCWNDDHTILYVTFNLTFEHKYGFTLLGDQCLTQDGYCSESLSVDFETGKANVRKN